MGSVILLGVIADQQLSRRKQVGALSRSIVPAATPAE
jgi:hypothetical protein